MECVDLRRGGRRGRGWRKRMMGGWCGGFVDKVGRTVVSVSVVD